MIYKYLRDHLLVETEMLSNCLSKNGDCVERIYENLPEPKVAYVSLVSRHKKQQIKLICFLPLQDLVLPF